MAPVAAVAYVRVKQERRLHAAVQQAPKYDKYARTTSYSSLLVRGRMPGLSPVFISLISYLVVSFHPGYLTMTVSRLERLERL